MTSTYSSTSRGWVQNEMSQHPRVACIIWFATPQWLAVDPRSCCCHAPLPPCLSLPLIPPFTPSCLPHYLLFSFRLSAPLIIPSLPSPILLTHLQAAIGVQRRHAPQQRMEAAVGGLQLLHKGGWLVKDEEDARDTG